MSEPTRRCVERFWQTANARDWDGFAALLHPDLLYLVPQTHERARGRAGFVEVFRTWPGPWRAEVTLIIAEADRAACTINFIVDGEAMTGISFFALSAGLVTHVTDYWPSPYEPPPRATPAMERF